MELFIPEPGAAFSFDGFVLEGWPRGRCHRPFTPGSLPRPNERRRYSDIPVVWLTWAPAPAAAAVAVVVVARIPNQGSCVTIHCHRHDLCRLSF